MHVMGNRLFLGLILAILVGSFLRLWQLNDIPPGLHGDEALVGYTSYSLILTGKDLVGQTGLFSLHDINMGGTFPPLLSYVMTPFVSMFGLSPFIVRLPSALFGIFSIYAIYQITRLLFTSSLTSLIAAWLMAVNPWAIHLSRQGQLESISLALVLSGVWLFLLSGKRIGYSIGAFISWGLSLFAYDAPRAFLPPFIAVFFWYQWHKVRWSKALYIGISIFALFYGVFLFQTFFRGESMEYTRSLASGSSDVANMVVRGHTLTNAPRSVAYFFHNKVTETTRILATNYVNIFSINWFFVNGYGNIQEAVGNHGQYYLFELPLFFLGWFLLFRNSKKNAWLLLGWLLLGALPGGLSNGNYAYRSSLLLPVPIIVSAIGFTYLFTYISSLKRILRNLVLVGTSVIIVLNISSYIVTYFYEYPVYASEAWAKQQNDAIQYAAGSKAKYPYIFIDGTAAWAANYGFTNRISPALYQLSMNNPVQFANAQYMLFDGIYFRPLSDAVRLSPSTSQYFPKGSLVITIGADDVFPDDVPVMRFMAPGDTHATYKAIVVN